MSIQRRRRCLCTRRTGDLRIGKDGRGRESSISLENMEIDIVVNKFVWNLTNLTVMTNAIYLEKSVKFFIDNILYLFFVFWLNFRLGIRIVTFLHIFTKISKYSKAVQQENNFQEKIQFINVSECRSWPN